MGKQNELPGFSEKRKSLFGKRTSSEKLCETGRAFAAAERYDDALEFFGRADAEGAVREVAQIAISRGDTPLYMRAKKILGEKITPEEWHMLARGALAAGSPTKAYVALVKAGRKEEAEALKAQIEGYTARETQDQAGQGSESAASAEEKSSQERKES